MFMKRQIGRVQAAGVDHDVKIFIQINKIRISKKLLILCQRFISIPLIIPLFACFIAAPVNKMRTNDFMESDVTLLS